MCSETIGELGTRSCNLFLWNGVCDRAVSLGVEAEGELCARAINLAVPNLHPNQAVICSIYSHFVGKKSYLPHVLSFSSNMSSEGRENRDIIIRFVILPQSPPYDCEIFLFLIVDL